VLAQICSDAVELWNGRVFVLAHVKELLEQAADKLRLMAPALPIGVYSAGLGRRDIGYAVTIAGVQSVYERAYDMGPADLIIVDEAHLIPPDGEGMYRRFLTDAKEVNPHVRVIGLTATPYRMKTGMICGADTILNHVCFEVGVRELITGGFICPLRSRAGKAKPDTSELHVRAGEFKADEVENLMDTSDLVEAACDEIVSRTRDRHSVLIFCAGVAHAEHVVEVMAARHKVECGFVCGKTSEVDRAKALYRFRTGELRYLANVNVLTTGFDAPNIDCIALLRPTLSPGLYYQMVGRGFRMADGKTDCLVMDFGGNVIRHGPVDAIRLADPNKCPGDPPAKECPECNALIHAACATCPECGHAFPPRKESAHDAMASDEEILSGQSPTRHDEKVHSVDCYVHHKQGDPLAKPTMRVEYEIGFNTYAKEWVCLEHKGYARKKAEQWWRLRSNDPVPNTVEEAVQLADDGALADTLSITIEKKPGDKYERIVDCELGPKPPSAAQLDAKPEHELDPVIGPNGWEAPF